MDCPSCILQPRTTTINTLPCSLSNYLCQTHSEISNLSIKNQILITDYFLDALLFPDFFFIMKLLNIPRLNTATNFVKRGIIHVTLVVSFLPRINYTLLE